MTTQEKIELVCSNFSTFLKEKNRRYGDSAMAPIKIFSRIDADSQLCNRIDDKLNRIKNNSGPLRKNDLCDVVGYAILLLIANDWTNFNDLLD